jgi:outer membrane protein TolC
MPNTPFMRIILAVGVVYLSCLPLQAQEIHLHSLEEVLLFAKTNAPEQKIWKMQGQQQEYAPRMSSAELLPKVRLFATWDNYLQLPVQLLPSEAVGGEPGTFTEIRFGTQFQTSTGIEASLPLFDPELWSRIKTERLRSRYNLQDISQQEQAWTEDIARAYYQLLLHLESRKLAEARHHLSDSIYRLAEITYQTGEMEPLPFQRIQATALAAQNALSRQKKQEENARQTLRSLIGAGERMLHFDEKIKASELKPAFADYELAALPEWKKADLLVNMNEQSWKNSRAKHLPRLAASGQFFQQALGNEFGLREAGTFEVGVIGLSLNWDIFQGNFKRLKTKTAYLDWQISKEQQQRTRELLAEERDRLETDLIQNQGLVTGFGPLLNLYAENFRLAGIQWAEGQISVDELLQVEREWIEQQQEYLIALSDLFTSKALLAIRNQSYAENR